MKELNYLSKEFVEIDSLMVYRAFIDFTSFKKENNWDDCCISCIESGTSWNYYKINLQRSKEIIIGKGSRCQIRRINKGLFKDCYCVVEARDGNDTFTILYVFDKMKLLRYPKFEKQMTAKQIDLLLDQKQIENVTAKLLNQFDISKRHQEYEFFCENLPDACWKAKDFSKNILAKFEQLGEIKLTTEVDKKFVKLDMCKAIARDYFESLTKKKNQEKTL